MSYSSSFLIFQLPSTKKLSSLDAAQPPEFSETIHRDQINDLLVSHYNCRERLIVRRFSFNQVDDCSANALDVANNKARVHQYIRARSTTITGYQYSPS